MARLLGIAGVQMSVIPWDVDATLANMEGAVHEIGRSFPWVQLIVFHKLCASAAAQLAGTPSAEQWAQMCQPIPGETTERLCALAKREQKWILPGSLYERAGDKLYNSAVVISPAGEIIARYRKVFPWYPFESETERGRDFCVFDIPDVGRFGISICYDMWFPETIRTLAWMGAEVILHPTLTTTPDRALELILSQSHAITNQCYFVDINCVGPWGGGSSLIVDPDGRVLQQSGSHEAILVELLDLDHVTRSREYGTLGMAQSLKQLRDANIDFPPYIRGIATGEGFKSLGSLKNHKRLLSPGLMSIFMSSYLKSSR